MDIAEGLDSVAGNKGRPVEAKERPFGTHVGCGMMRRLATGKRVGLVFGCLVVAVMLFMMFAVLGGLLSGEP
jgi:hypothetical protein